MLKKNFRDPQKAQKVRNVFWHIDRQNRCSGLCSSELEEPKKTSQV